MMSSVLIDEEKFETTFQLAKQNIQKNESALIQLIKEVVTSTIDTYLSQVNRADTPFYNKVSFSTLNSFVCAYAGEEGRQRAGIYKDKINNINSLGELLWTLYRDLDEASRENEKKTALNQTIAFLGKGYDYLRTTIGYTPSENNLKETLGNSTFLANNIAKGVCKILNLNNDLISEFKDLYTQENYINPELRAMTNALYGFTLQFNDEKPAENNVKKLS